MVIAVTNAINWMQIISALGDFGEGSYYSCNNRMPGCSQRHGFHSASLSGSSNCSMVPQFLGSAGWAGRKLPHELTWLTHGSDSDRGKKMGMGGATQPEKKKKNNLLKQGFSF